MGISPETRLITKNTFLEIVVDEASAALDTRRRSFTDGAIMSRGSKSNELCYTGVSTAAVEQQASPAQLHLAGENAGGLQDNPTCKADKHEEVRACAGAEQSLMQPMAPMGYYIVPMLFMAEQSGRMEAHEPQNVTTSSRPRQSERPHTKPSKQAGAPRAPLSLANTVSTANGSSSDEFTTLMLRNLPNQYNRDMLVDLLNREGFAGMFNFVYLPIDFKTHAGLGYAFVDLVSRHETERMRQHFEGFSHWAVRSDKVCGVSWSHPEQQGYAAHVERYRNSPVMHECVPDSWKPALFSGGKRVSFPPPTKKLRSPNIQNLL